MPTLRWHNVQGVSVPVVKLRLYGIEGAGAPPSTPKLRLFKVEGAGTTVYAKLRLFHIEGSGSAPSNPKLRWINVEGSGGGAPVLEAIAALTVEPLTMINITAVLAGGSATPDAWLWRLMGGYPVTLINTTTQTVSFESPAPDPPSPRDVILGVQAFTSGAPSAEVSVTITTLPQLDWTWNGTTWVASKVIAV